MKRGEYLGIFIRPTVLDIRFFFLLLPSLLAHLDSIPELLADSCKEIKSSEDGQAVGVKYWLNFIKPDTPVLANCYMRTEGRVR